MSRKVRISIPAVYEYEVVKLLFDRGVYSYNERGHILNSKGQRVGDQRGGYDRITLSVPTRLRMILQEIAPGIDVVNSNPRLNTDAHRIISFLENGPTPDGYVIDHEDEEKSNNSPHNLRPKTVRENSLKGQRNKPKVRRFNLPLEEGNTVVLPKEVIEDLSIGVGESVKLEYRGRTWYLRS